MQHKKPASDTIRKNQLTFNHKDLDEWFTSKIKLEHNLGSNIDQQATYIVQQIDYILDPTILKKNEMIIDDLLTHQLSYLNPNTDILQTI